MEEPSFITPQTVTSDSEFALGYPPAKPWSAFVGLKNATKNVEGVGGVLLDKAVHLTRA
jgi:hypothetical protein